ncbi:hypothetical protein [Bacillus sp. RIT694]|uniref:hypothetical protein n=1 Tax=Bacillus sp. RIT694 TaxID=2666190 RepID=UPI0012ACC100|nr:hypothetical protein [Bacillus sp. RIT694]MRS25876.1 hypothetical protein [Bacillus sp. RIT694]
MDYEISVSKLEGVLSLGKMTSKAKEDIQEVIDMMNEVLEKQQVRDRAGELGLQTFYNKAYIEKDLMNSMNAFCSHPKGYEMACDDLKKMQGMQEDILHMLELFEDDDETLMNHMKDLVVIRKQRRLAKDYMELTKPIKVLISKYPNIGKELKQCLKNVREVQEQIRTRKYTPRELTAMEEAFKKFEVV